MVQLPQPFSDIPREQLLFDSPPSIDKLSRLTLALKCGTTFWMKRDDCNSGLASGGNKVRKMEYLIPDALAQGADTLVTTGGLQSNHMRQVSAIAARYGLKAVLLPVDVVESDHAEYRSLGNIQLTHLMSAEHFSNQTTEEAMAKVRSGGGNPYFIPAGASTHPLGGLGYARWAFEIQEQENALGVYFDTIVAPFASGSTLGGMVAGFKLMEKIAQKKSSKTAVKRKIIGISAMARSVEETNNLLLQIARTAAEKIGLDPADISEEDFTISLDYSAGAYGKLDDRTIKGVKELASLEGIITDPVYSGKAITGLLDMARSGQFSGSENVLFCHTGGEVSLSAYPQLR